MNVLAAASCVWIRSELASLIKSFPAIIFSDKSDS